MNRINRRVSACDLAAKKTVTKAITGDIADTTNKNVTNRAFSEISSVDLMGVACRMMNILYTRLIIAIVSV